MAELPRCPWPCDCPREPINRVVKDEKGVLHLEHLATAVKCERDKPKDNDRGANL